MWAGNRSLERYAEDFLTFAASPYGRRRFRTLALRDRGALVASLKRYERDFHYRGNAFKGVGIGAVFTPPGARGRGYATAMLATLLDRERAGGTDLAYLFSDIHPAFYSKLGFIALPSRVLSLRVSSLADRRRNGERVEFGALEGRDADGVRRCFEALEGRRGFGLRRTPLVWDWIRSRPTGSGQPVELTLRAGRSIAAYVSGRREPRTDSFVLDEFAFAQPEYVDTIAPLLRAAAGDLGKVTGWLPPAPARDALPRGSVRRRRDAIAMLVPLSRAARAMWKTVAADVLHATHDLFWSADHV